MNRQRDVETIWERMGRPALLTEDEWGRFSRRVAASFSYGVPAWGIAADAVPWGMRQNSTGTVSRDTIRQGDVRAVDLAAGAGAPGWRFHWLEFRPGTPDFGVGVEPVGMEWLPGVEPVPAPPPGPVPLPELPPCDMKSDLLDLSVTSRDMYYVWVHRRYELLAVIERWAKNHAGVDPYQLPAGHVGHAVWRMLREPEVWGPTVRDVLQRTWPPITS